MPNCKEQFKKSLSTFGNVTKIKNDLAHKQRNERKKRRTNNFEDIRRKTSNFSPISQERSSTNEFPTKDAKTKNNAHNIEMPTERNKEHTVEYFKHLLYKERDRLQKHCEHWTNMQLRDNIEEDIRCRINQAVEQTTLLLEKRFPQFYGLILICEGGDADKPIFCTDLHEFWDMMYLEVKDCDSRFAKLEELRARRWREEQSFSANSAKISDQKKKEMTKMRDNKEADINMNNEFVTPFTSGKKRQVRIETVLIVRIINVPRICLTIRYICQLHS